MRKVALIIGNENYEILEKLHLCIKDTNLINSALEELGFITKLCQDLKHTDLRNVVSDFGEDVVEDGDLVFFYYSGHAGQQTINNTTDNYLFGIDAKLEENGKTKGVSFRRQILDRLYKQSLYIFVFDSCRVYPNANQQYTSKSAQGTSVQLEYGAIDSRLTLSPLDDLPIDKEYDIVYACQPGKPAYEKKDQEYGYLAKALHDSMKNASTWDEATRQMIRRVKEQSGHQQIPSVTQGIGRTLYFLTDNPSPTTPEVPNRPPSSSQGRWRTEEELNHMSSEDKRNTLIVELSKHTNQQVGYFQGFNNNGLIGKGALVALLKKAKIRTLNELQTMTDDDERNTLIVENHNHTGKPIPYLQGMSNQQLVELGLQWFCESER